MFKRLPLLSVTFCAIMTWSFATTLHAQEPAPPPTSEQILSYDSDLTVNPDGTLVVRETITVFAMGTQIKHAIYRDIPTHYDDRFGNPYAVHFEVASVERDAQPEDFHLERIPNGLRVYMGNSREVVPPGQHTYELTYSVDREIGFFSDHDELYWNVTGNGWMLPIQEASATLHLPPGIAQQAIMLDAYTGRQGSAGTDYTASADSQSNATFRASRALGPGEGLTLVARWPKGFVRPPTDDQKYHYFLEDNQPTLIGLAGLIVILIFYIAVWFLAGRDPAGGEIVPISEPPRGFSPAAIRYLWRKAFDQKTMVANLVDLAVKKQLAILEDGSGAYILGRVKPDMQPSGAGRGSGEGPMPEITPDEKLVFDKLFAADDTIPLVPVNHAIVGGAVEALHHHLRSKLERVYFLASARYLIPGLLISLATVVRCGFTIQGGQGILVLFLTIGLLLWSLGSLTVGCMAIAAWRYALSDPHHAPTARKQALILSAICVPFFVCEAAGLGVMAWAASTGVVVTFILLVAINYVFHILLKAPTRSGRALMNQIEGFRMFLATTEQDHRDARTPLQTASHLFERFLPYALALNVEKVWGEKFAVALAQSAQRRSPEYTPGWYFGPSWDPITTANFATSLGSAFSSAVSSSTMAPGSSFGNSGFSGGGGGGGGGR